MKQRTITPDVYPSRVFVKMESWSDPTYAPHEFTHGTVLGNTTGRPAWADDTDYNSAEVSQRLCFADDHSETTVGERCAIHDGRYCNPKGKTGLKGRGLLGRWGPNHAADVIVTRYDKDVLQVLLIQRHLADKQSSLAFPAGMVEPGADVPATLRAELTQEAVEDSDAVNELFRKCRVGVVYRGHVDDFRNTDNAWVETTAVHFHATHHVATSLRIGVADKEEVAGVAWHDAESITAMYASHMEWLQLVMKDMAAKNEAQKTKRKRVDDDDVDSVKRPANDEDGAPVYVG